MSIASILALLAVAALAYLILAKTDEQCRREASCDQAGLCKASFQTCIAATSEDCQKAQNCLEYGECTAKDGRCVVASDKDCANICKSSDRCKAREGRCVCDPSQAASCLELGKCGVDDKGWCTLFTVEGCKASTNCSRNGLCALAQNKDGCMAATDADCQESEACKKDSRCKAKDGRCVLIDCPSSEMCTVQGRCMTRRGECVAGKDEDCEASTWCRDLGRCKERNGVCRPTQAACKASSRCQQDGACFLSRDGEACVTKAQREVEG